jgi:hypothetical protein
VIPDKFSRCDSGISITRTAIKKMTAPSLIASQRKKSVALENMMRMGMAKPSCQPNRYSDPMAPSSAAMVVRVEVSILYGYYT